MIRLLLFALIFLLNVPCGLAIEGPDPSKAVTAKEPALELTALSLLLMPLTHSQLENEIVAWQKLLQKVVADLADAQLKLHKIAEIEKAKEAGEELPPAAALGPEVEVSQKEAIAKEAGKLLAARSALLERFEVVLDEYEKKGGVPTIYRTFAKAVSGVKVDWTDPHSAWETIATWLFSEEGGLAWVKRIAHFLAVIVGAYLVGGLASLLFGLLFRISRVGSELLRRFIVKWSRRLVFLIGVLMGLSALGLNITPLIAAIGATGFIVGFALQNTMSNVASGILIMSQRPFDVGDAIDAEGVSGKVDKVGLFSTHITTFDNSKLIVPNDTIWSSVITNTTAADIKRLDLTFDLKVNITAEAAEMALLKAVVEHPKVLEEPAPTVRLDDIIDEGFRLICWPWVKTSDAREVRWDIVRHVKDTLHADLSEEPEAA
jgi:small conductance mechanosensitive channel